MNLVALNRAKLYARNLACPLQHLCCIPKLHDTNISLQLESSNIKVKFCSDMAANNGTDVIQEN
jgi:hypothetical protein